MRTSHRIVCPTVRSLVGAVVLVACAVGAPAGAPVRPQPARTGGQTGETGAVRLRVIGADAQGGRAAAVVVEWGALVHSTAMLPVDRAGRLQGGADGHAQAAHALSHLEVALRAGGTTVDQLVRLHVYVADASVTPAVDRLLAERFAGAAKPAVTIVESRMPVAGVLVAMDAVAATTRRPPSGAPVRLVVDGLPSPIGGGAHVSIQPEGPFVVVSGRAASGELEPAVRGTMAQLRDDLRGVGLGFEHVVQVKTFLGDMARAEQVQQIVAGVFYGTAPPQVVTEWRDASLPVEIELIATAPGAVAPGGERLSFVEPIASRFSRVARVFDGRPIFVSGLVGASADPVVQVREIFTDLRRLLEEGGSDLRHLAKATYYVSDKAADQEINAIRPTIFDAARPPAASKISVQGTGRPGKGTVIDMIAVTASR